MFGPSKSGQRIARVIQCSISLVWTFGGDRAADIVNKLSISRKRRVVFGVGLAVVGVVILSVSLIVLTSLLCSDPFGGCRWEYHWPTIIAGLTLIALGFVVSMMRLRSERR